MFSVLECVACAGCFARAALLVVTCDVTWAAEPLSFCCYLRCYLRVCALGVLPSLLWWWLPVMLPVFRCVACAGCFALGALLVVTCDVTWAAAPLSVLLLPVLLPACVCSGRVTVVGVEW